jgi:hypothetical protein
MPTSDCPPSGGFFTLLGMFSAAVIGVFSLLAFALLIRSYPEVRRYLQMRSM